MTDFGNAARVPAAKISDVCLSFDLDWAPEFVLEDLRQLLAGRGLAATFFCTHDSSAVRTLLEGGEPALHPNFLGQSDEAEHLRQLQRWFPEARGVRNHVLYYHSKLLPLFHSQGVEYFSNDLRFLEAGLTPSWDWSGLVRLPIYWEDDVHCLYFDGDFGLERLQLERPGLKVLSFHPVHIYLNTSSAAEYQRVKEVVRDAALAPRLRTSGPGIRSLFLELLELLRGQTIKPLGEVARVFGRNTPFAGQTRERWSKAAATVGAQKTGVRSGLGRKRILVTGCGGPLGVNVTRSLLWAPEALHLVGTDCDPHHLHLSLAHRSVRIAPAREPDRYLADLDALVAEEKIEQIVPTHPVEVRAISQNRQRWPGVRIVLPEHESIVLADNKWETYRALQAAGSPVPRTFLIEREDDLARCFEELERRPVWVRGSGAPGLGIGVASLPCRELRHAVAWVEHFRGWGGFIASEYLPGRNLTWCGLFFASRLLAAQSRERLAYVIPHVSPSGITGAPAVTRTISEPELHRLGEAAVRVISPQPNGVYFVDFKEDAEGRPRITEINAGRFGTTIHFYTAAGCNFPYLLVRAAFGEPVEGAPLIDPIAAGTTWVRTLDCGPALLRPGVA